MLLVTSEMFVNTLTDDVKYSRHNRENFPQQIEMEFYKKIFFSQFFIAFLNSKSQFEYFEKTDESQSLIISEIIDSFISKRVKGFKELLKSVRHHFYTTVSLI